MPADPRRVVGDDELVRVQHAAGRPTAGPGPRRGVAIAITDVARLRPATADKRPTP